MQKREEIQQEPIVNYYALNFRKVNHPKYSKLYIDVLIRGLLNGLSISKACNLAKILEKDVFDWMEESEEFEIVIKWAKATYEEEILKRVKDSASRNPTVALNLLKELRKNEKDVGDEYEDSSDALADALGGFD